MRMKLDDRDEILKYYGSAKMQGTLFLDKHIPWIAFVEPWELFCQRTCPELGDRQRGLESRLSQHLLFFWLSPCRLQSPQVSSGQ